jgi:hypothetical protein
MKKTTQSKAIKGFFQEGHQIAVTAYNNYNLITKIIQNKINNL